MLLAYCMAKNSRQQIEEDERKIIQELLRNANKSINEIAINCGFSKARKIIPTGTLFYLSYESPPNGGLLSYQTGFMRECY